MKCVHVNMWIFFVLDCIFEIVDNHDFETFTCHLGYANMEMLSRSTSHAHAYRVVAIQHVDPAGMAMSL